MRVWCYLMNTVEFLVKEFPDGRLMFLIQFEDGKNFRAHRKGNKTKYTWCAHEDDLEMANKIYKAVDRFNKEFIKKQNERRDLKKNSDLKPFYT